MRLRSVFIHDIKSFESVREDGRNCSLSLISFVSYLLTLLKVIYIPTMSTNC